MKKIISALSVLVLSFFYAGIAQAQVLTDAQSVIDKGVRIGNSIITILISISVIYIVYAVVRYVISSSPDEKSAGAKQITWGIIGLAIILSIWGLVAIIKGTFNTGTNQAPEGSIPRVIQPNSI